MKLGKLTTQELERNVISLLGKKRAEVLLSAALGEDCAALKIDDTVLVSSDPITAVMELSKLGALCVSVCCNDIAANGGQPVAMTMTVIMPPSSQADDVGVIMRGAVERAKELDVDIVGGHTEFSDCVVRPIVSGTAIGRVKRLVKKTDLKAGDRLFVTKKLGLEGTCILADIISPDLTIAEREKLDLFNSSLDVTKESRILSKLESVSMMHDVTEGGVLGAVAEVCFSAGLGAEIFQDKMPVDELTRKLCATVGVDPLRLISSGSMLVAASGCEAAEELVENGIACTEIGRVNDKNKVVLVKSDNSREEIDILPDELYKFSKEVSA